MAGRIRGWIGRLALLGLGAVFVIAGGLKALDPEGFVEQVAAFGMVSPSVVQAVPYLLIPIEVALGVALLLDYRRRWTVPAAVVLLFGFLGLMLYAASTGGDVSACGCFGSFVERSPEETMAEDIVFIAVALLGLMAPKRAAEGGVFRGALVAVGAVAALAFVPLAPRLPLDNLVTALKPGVSLKELRLSVPDAAFSKGRYLVALLALEEETSGEAADALSALAALPGAPQVAVIHADEEETEDAFFWMHAPAYPMYQVVDEEMKRLYRRLPRFFLLEGGVVKEVWESLPAPEALIVPAAVEQEEASL